ncbi:glycoside hydrolase family 3 N-terminal domain-containing protein [Microbacterium sp.]|uniref:glycoside hydrolase family 3 protein n=1 Tax=Microbacterium sp. TaxID=51671 RepID=UPI00092C213C|nr:glycoside hydrolase family 3 N-terminal domain-containing protein [Microbacterium sp.]OJU70123.1 MAG: beta-glucosidase [Microbacterium sp. 70-38]
MSAPTSLFQTHHDGTRYRDLNRNGRMDPFEDPRLSADERVADLVPRLSLREKAGLLFHSIISVPESGDLDGPLDRDYRTGIRELVGGRHVTHINVHQLPSAQATVRWVNEVQELAEQAPHGIPVTISTDPRHSFLENWGASFHAGFFSAWPEPIGLGAIGDPDVVREFARTARAEYAAVGIRAALHPTLDLATEPRWPRQYSTFGQDAGLVRRLAAAYIDGFEGPRLGPGSVACMAKHFPGGGPQLDGEDPHFPYGREQVYPGGMFDYHLEPFRAVIDRGVSAMMLYYGMPVGLVLDGEPVEPVGFAFSRQIVTGLLRERLGFTGVVSTDWGLVTGSQIGDRSLPARAWGVEHLSALDRARRILDAGCDQFGGEDDPSLVIRLVESGAVDESRIDESVARVLRVKFELGLFDDPYVTSEGVDSVGTPPLRALGHSAQARATTLLVNAAPPGAARIPLQEGLRVYSEDVDARAIVRAGLSPVADVGDADVAIVRLDAPFEPRDDYMLESSFHAGSLEFASDVVERVERIAVDAPVILAVQLDRPAILTPLMASVASLVAVYGASDDALLDALTGKILPEGKLPFQLPRDAGQVIRSHPDVPGDVLDPLFDAGAGGKDT